MNDVRHIDLFDAVGPGNVEGLVKPVPVLGTIDPGVSWGQAVLWSNKVIKVSADRLSGEHMRNRVLDVRLLASMMPRCPEWLIELPWIPGPSASRSRRSLVHLSINAGAWAGALGGMVSFVEPYAWNSRGRGLKAAEDAALAFGLTLKPDALSALGMLLWRMNLVDKPMPEDLKVEEG